MLDALADGNRAYEDRFGYIFIVCATGRSAAEMLALLRARLPNDAGDRDQDRGGGAGEDHGAATAESG